MATSGSLAPVSYKANVLFEEAASRAGIVPNVVTGEMIIRFLRMLNTTLEDFLNWGIPLWTRQQLLIPTYEGVARVDMPEGTSLVLSANRRTYQRPEGTNVSSASGTVAYAFDGDFDTELTQTSTNGNVQTAFGSATTINGVGLLAGATATFSGVVEASSDGSTWKTIITLTAESLVDEEWLWLDTDYAKPMEYWRLRATGGSTIILRELYWGNTPQEIPLGVYGLDDYNWLPNKFQLGQITQFYQQRDAEVTYVLVWPLTSETNKYDHLVVWRERYIYSVTTINQALEIPRRWQEALTAIMADKVCEAFKEADKTKQVALAARAREARTLAMGEERDLGPMTLLADISMYTRG